MIETDINEILERVKKVEETQSAILGALKTNIQVSVLIHKELKNQSPKMNFKKPEEKPHEKNSSETFTKPKPGNANKT